MRPMHHGRQVWSRFSKMKIPTIGINTSNYVGKYCTIGDAVIENGDEWIKAKFFDYSVTWFRCCFSSTTKVRCNQNDPNYGQNSGENMLHRSKWVELVYNFSTTTATNLYRVQLILRIMAFILVTGYFDIFTKAIHL